MLFCVHCGYRMNWTEEGKAGIEEARNVEFDLEQVMGEINKADTKALGGPFSLAEEEVLTVSGWCCHTLRCGIGKKSV